MDWNSPKVKYCIIVAVVVAVYIIAAGMKWYEALNPVSPQSWTPPEQIQEVERIRRIIVPGPTKIVTIEKEKVVEKLKLPEWVAKDDSKQVIATADLQPTHGGYQVAGLIDTTTGEGSIIAKEKRQPFFEMVNEVEISAGIATDKTVDAALRYAPFRIGKAYLAGQVEGDSNGDARLTGRVVVRW